MYNHVHRPPLSLNWPHRPIGRGSAGFGGSLDHRYQGILFPDRAENLHDFEGYKVFLEHWDSLGQTLRDLYEGLALRRDTKALAIHGTQGAGKTLFAEKLATDIERSQLAIQKGVLTADPSNLWHRICGTSNLNPDFIEQATRNVVVRKVENSKDWVKATADWLQPQKDKHCILIADNAERGYFRQGLLSLSDAEYIQLGESEQAMKLVAQNFIAKCRGELRGTLFLVLSNDDKFLLQLWDATQQQHQGLVELASLPLPQGADKEAIIRVNTNRLNPISYWFCLDKAGPEYKKAVRTALLGAATYPAAFAAVNNAIRDAAPSRVGRSARKNLISLVVLANDTAALLAELPSLGGDSTEEFATSWASSIVFGTDWAKGVITDERQRQFLESEWDLRVVVLGSPFVGALLSGDARVKQCETLIEGLKRVFGPVTWTTTRDALRIEIETMVTGWPDVSDVDLQSFWSAGQGRAAVYEAVLRTILPGYNIGGMGFTRFRPDHIVEGFKPCAVSSAISDDVGAINIAIRREAHALEFTAQVSPTLQSLKTYLATKLPNYVELTQET